MKRTTEDLREILFGTIDDLREGKIDANDAGVISKLSTNIVATASLELQHAKTLSELDEQDQGINPGAILLTSKTVTRSNDE